MSTSNEILDRAPHEQRCIVVREHTWIDCYGAPRGFVKMVTTTMGSVPWWEAKGYALLCREPEQTIDISGLGDPQSGPRRVDE